MKRESFNEASMDAIDVGSIASRFRKKYSPVVSGCWEWTGCLTPNGYPQISVNSIPHYAHRVAYALFVAPIPDGQLVLHKCDNRKCVNPDHLFLGNHLVNSSDKIAKGRQPSGIERKGAKLNDDIVRMIRRDYKTGLYSFLDLGERLGVSQRTIGKAITRKTWKHVK